MKAMGLPSNGVVIAQHQNRQWTRVDFQQRQVVEYVLGHNPGRMAYGIPAPTGKNRQHLILVLVELFWQDMVIGHNQVTIGHNESSSQQSVRTFPTDWLTRG